MKRPTTTACLDTTAACCQTDDALAIFDTTNRIADIGVDQRVNGPLRDTPAQYGGNLINLGFVSLRT